MADGELGEGGARESLTEEMLPFVKAGFVSAKASRCPAQDRFSALKEGRLNTHVPHAAEGVLAF